MNKMRYRGAPCQFFFEITYSFQQKAFLLIQPTTAKFAVICMMFLNEYPFNKVILMVNKGSIADRDNSLTIWWLVVALSDPIMTQK